MGIVFAERNYANGPFRKFNHSTEFEAPGKQSIL